MVTGLSKLTRRADDMDRRVNDLELIQALKQAVSSLYRPKPLHGAIKLIALVAMLMALLVGYFGTSNLLASAILIFLTSIVYAILALNSHELAHGTVMGKRRLEQALGRLISWPILWPFATYSLLHRWHHYFNGWSPMDPESKVVSTRRDSRIATAFHNWQVRNVLWSSLVAGGIGLTFQLLNQSRLRILSGERGVAKVIIVDLAGMFMIQLILLVGFAHYNCLLKYLVAVLLLERIVGGVIQAHRLLEHHGLWRENSGPGILTQLYSSRNILAPFWINFLMAGIPYHAIHHAFPGMPSIHLLSGAKQIDSVLSNHGMEQVPHYNNYHEAIKKLVMLEF